MSAFGPDRTVTRAMHASVMPTSDTPTLLIQHLRGGAATDRCFLWSVFPDLTALEEPYSHARFLVIVFARQGLQITDRSFMDYISAPTPTG